MRRLMASGSDSLPLGEKGVVFSQRICKGNRGPDFSGQCGGGKTLHGYIAEKTNPGALASGPEGTEEVSTLFRKI
ncbi:MAG: hypothetical protein ACQEQO_12475 [Thermodesulfobacteriota bacterium]